MRTLFTSMLTAFALSGLAPIAAFAQDPTAPGCGDYNDQLTAEQIAYLDGQDLAIQVPQGEVPIIQRCDVDGNNVVDINDIRAISLRRNQPAAHPDDPADWNRDNVITVNDARGCQLACALPRCATMSEEPAELQGGTSAPASCTQSDDFDGDGEPDTVAIFESTSQEEDRGEWTLDVVILNKDESGNVQHVTFPFTGQTLADTQEVTQHLSKQPCDTGNCMVNLAPGTLMIDKPAIVSYRNGEPKVIYYFVDGEVRRAYYGIDD